MQANADVASGNTTLQRRRKGQMAKDKHTFSLYERDARVYEPPTSYAYDPPITAQELKAQLEASSGSNEHKNGKPSGGAKP
jgi:hypothetical protein